MTKPIDEFHLHEALDRVELIKSMVEQWLVGHPAIDMDAEMKRCTEEARRALQALYHRAADLRFAEDVE